MKKIKIIKYLDGFRLKHSIIASAIKVDQNQEILNDINVFPVPDGDTGTNMAETMQVIAKGAENAEHTSFGDMSDTIADSALEGARGNSGVILAQFFQGLADKARGKSRLETHDFAHVVDTAVQNAEAAVSQPKEGTILTVMRDWANHVKEHAHLESNFIELLKSALGRARQSLADTPKKLKVLRAAGVVDAGAQGFVHILEGMLEFLETGKMTAMSAGVHVVDKIRHHSHSAEEVAKFQFCTQCLIIGENVDRAQLRNQLTPLGDSIIVIGSNKKSRIHIHSNEPEHVFEIAASYGKVTGKKAENMRAQFEQTMAASTMGNIALVTDSTCDLPDEILRENNVYIVPVNLRIDGKEFIDKVDIQPDEFYKIFEASDRKVSTSQPSLAAFKNTYEQAAKNYKSIISIHISKHISGTINGARLALQSLKENRTFSVVDSHATSVGLGLIVKEAISLVKSGMSHKDIVDSLNDAVKNLRLYASLPAFKHAIKSGRIPKTKGVLALLLNIRPVVSFDKNGKITDVAKVLGARNVPAKVFKLAVQYAEKVERPRFAIAHAKNEKVAEEMAATLRRQFKTDEVFIQPASPALGAQLGLGAMAISVLGNSR
jgi:uncharacterized protein